MDLRASPPRGTPVRADWAREVGRRACRQRLVAGHGLRITETPGNTIVSLASPSGPRYSRRLEHYPYGPKWNFGVSFSGLDLTVHGGVIYHAGVALLWPEPLEPVITGLQSGAHVCVILRSGVISIEQRSPPLGDSDGAIVRALLRVRVSEGAADIDKWLWPAADIAAMGTF